MHHMSQHMLNPKFLKHSGKKEIPILKYGILHSGKIKRVEVWEVFCLLVCFLSFNNKAHSFKISFWKMPVQNKPYEKK